MPDPRCPETFPASDDAKQPTEIAFKEQKMPRNDFENLHPEESTTRTRDTPITTDVIAVPASLVDPRTPRK